jgi:hypothetical protein
MNADPVRKMQIAKFRDVLLKGFGMGHSLVFRAREAKCGREVVVI